MKYLGLGLLKTLSLCVFLLYDGSLPEPSS